MNSTEALKVVELYASMVADEPTDRALRLRWQSAVRDLSKAVDDEVTEFEHHVAIDKIITRLLSLQQQRSWGIRFEDSNASKERIRGEHREAIHQLINALNDRHPCNKWELQPMDVVNDLLWYSNHFLEIIEGQEKKIKGLKLDDAERLERLNYQMGAAYSLRECVKKAAETVGA